MSSAHTCFRSALVQAFASYGRGVVASYSVPAFLVPALTQPSTSPFSSEGRRFAHSQSNSHAQTKQTDHVATHEQPLSARRRPIQSRIPFPPNNARGDIEAWLAAVEPFLPPPLRKQQTDSSDLSGEVTSFDLACVLDIAQQFSLDIISHLGLAQGRWQAVVWICKKLVEEGRRSIEPPDWLDPSKSVLLLHTGPQTMKELSEGPIRIERLRHPRKPRRTLSEILSTPDSINARHIVLKRALGQLWRSLGSLILVASEQLHPQAGQVMPHVLEIIATLHHTGFIPDSVYTYHATRDKYGLRQPPTLNMLSSKILTALSDASWRAHEASTKAARTDSKSSYFLGYEIPESRYEVQVSELAPELWLELVLWSCLHGGWTLDGVNILQRLANRRGVRRWALASWREIMEAEEKKESGLSWWQSFASKKDTSASPQDRARTQRTISAEVVVAFIDGLVNQMRVGVGTRGYNPESLIQSLINLKRFLDNNNLGLGFSAWEAIMSRLLESGGLEPENRPEILLKICELAPGFGAEISTANAAALLDTDIPYFFEPTALTLSLLHRAMRAFIAIGDVKGAIKTLDYLQRHTDDNKEKSIKNFFEYMKSLPLPQRNDSNDLLSHRLPPVDFPAFDTKLPITVLAKLLDLATDSQQYDLARWMLFSNDIDGPLISSELYNHRNMSASIVRFGTIAGENDMVLDIIKKVQTWNPVAQQQRMPAEVLMALLCSQLRLRRWESVRGMQKYVRAATTFVPRAIILSTFAAELFRTSKDSIQERRKAQDAFTELLISWEVLLLESMRNELYCILGIMTSVDLEWKEFCSQFLAVNLRQAIKLSVEDFNLILGGVLDAYGSRRGQRLVERWCHTQSSAFRRFRAPGGLISMPRKRVDAGKEVENRVGDLEFTHRSGSKLTLQGRLLPNRQTIWAILREVQNEVDKRQAEGGEITRVTRDEIRDTVQWAARMLYYLGYEYEDTMQILGSRLAELAEMKMVALTNGKRKDSHDREQAL